LEAHLRSCRACSEEYEGNKRTVGFIEDHKAEFAAALESLEDKANQQQELERSWRCIEAKIDKLEAAEKREKRARVRRILVKVSAAAACLVIGVLIWHALPDSIAPDEPLAHNASSDPSSLLKIELISRTGNAEVAAGQQISTSAEQLRTLTINGRHRLVLNGETSVSIEPLSENNRPGCIVKLASGQIYANVEHDGWPFVVATAHGRAVITGTTFDVKSTQSGTTLVVAEGSVRFESEKGAVEVDRGQISEILANSTPTKPRSCDAAKLTAWATGHDLKKALAKIEPYSNDHNLNDLWLTANSGPIELENIDYDQWIEEKSPWFEREFPWIFQLQVALKAEGIEAEYPQLLIASGDIWQFAYPAATPQQIPFPYLDSILKMASNHGLDKNWIMENIPAAEAAAANPSQGQSTGIVAFEQWMACIEKMQKSSNTPDSQTVLYSLHAGVYLANTRTLAWLCLTNNKIDISPTDRAEILTALHTEVETANELSSRVIRLFAGVEDQPCDECRTLLTGIIENITTITGIEKMLEKEIKGNEGLN
jgi:ferric-dicitrate binding protein FerR (iron transport regulator)